MAAKLQTDAGKADRRAALEQADRQLGVEMLSSPPLRPAVQSTSNRLAAVGAKLELAVPARSRQWRQQLTGISLGFGDDKALESDRFTIGVSQHHLLMVRVVITGGPGAGKTTLLTELSARGYATLSESAREIIVARLREGLPPRPEPAAFAAEILVKDDEKYRRPSPSQGPVFFDRSAVDALAMVHEASPLSDDDLKARLSRYDFHRTVFVLPPWRAIYVNDSARDNPFVHAVAVHGQIVRWHERCGYRINKVPCLGVAQRATHLLAVIEQHA